MLFLHRVLDAYRSKRWPRRIAVGGCLALALLSAIGAHAPSHRQPTLDVVLARRALPAGAAITARDVGIAAYPRSLVPASSLRRVRDVVGRRTASPVGPGEVLTSRRLLGPSLAQGLPNGVVAVPVVVGSAGTDFVHVGDRVDLYRQPSTDGGDGATRIEAMPVLVSARLVVLAVLDAPDGDSPDGFTTTSSTAIELVVASYSQDAPKLLLPDSMPMVAVVAAPP